MEPTKEEIQAKMQKWKTLQQTIQGLDNEVLRERQRAQFSALFGPYVSGDYRIGDKIRVRLRPQPPEDEFSGVILWSYGPGETPVSHRHHPLTYVVDAGRGMPVLVHPTEIVQGKE